jgi:hypothetical protein
VVDWVGYAVVIGFGSGIVGGVLVGFEAPLDTHARLQDQLSRPPMKS